MNRDLLNYIVFGSVTVVVIVLYTIFAYLPQARRLSESKQAVIAQQAELARAQEMLTHFDELSDRSVRIDLEMQAMNAQFPEQPQIPELLRDVTRLATTCDLRNLQFAPLPLIDKETYAEQPVRITGTCHYHNLGRFISQLADQPRVIVARDVQITSRDKTGKTEAISVNFTLVTYVRKAQ